MKSAGLVALVLMMCELQHSILVGQEAFSLDPAAVEGRVKELRKDLVRSNENASAAVDRETTVQALVNIVEAHPDSSTDRKLLVAAFHELGSYPESPRALRCLFRFVDIRPSAHANADPLSSYPAALSLVRIGSRARDAILHSRVPLQPNRLHLFAHILARIEQTPDDSGRAVAIFRVSREIERLAAEPTAPELEEMKKHGIANLRAMLSLLSDPSFLAAEIPLPPAQVNDKVTTAR